MRAGEFLELLKGVDPELRIVSPFVSVVGDEYLAGYTEFDGLESVRVVKKDNIYVEDEKGEIVLCFRKAC